MCRHTRAREKKAREAEVMTERGPTDTLRPQDSATALDGFRLVSDKALGIGAADTADVADIRYDQLIAYQPCTIRCHGSVVRCSSASSVIVPLRSTLSSSAVVSA